MLDLCYCRKGTGRDIATEVKAEFERGSNILGLGSRPAGARTTGDIRTPTGAACDSECAGPSRTSQRRVFRPRDHLKEDADADPRRRVEKETVPSAVDGG